MMHEADERGEASQGDCIYRCIQGADDTTQSLRPP